MVFPDSVALFRRGLSPARVAIHPVSGIAFLAKQLLNLSRGTPRGGSAET